MRKFPLAGFIFPALISGCLSAQSDESKSDVAGNEKLSPALAEIVPYSDDTAQTASAEPKQTGKKVPLGDTVVLSAGQQSITTEDGLTVKTLSKPEGSPFEKFTFSKTPLKQALRAIGRWYDVEIDDNIPDRKVTGAFKRDLPFSEAIKACEIMSGVKLKLENGMVKVR